MPQTHGEAFTALAAHGVVEPELAVRLRAAEGLRSLIAHQYGAIDFKRLFAIAAGELDDLVRFCQQFAKRADSEPAGGASRPT